MNREIKFRAMAGGVMVYFDLFNITHIDAKDERKHIQRIESPHLSVSNGCPIMQYTGLKDSQGKEIYDQDILSDDMGRVGYVSWYQDGWVVIWTPALTYKKKILPQQYAKPLNMDILVSKVIGNVYQNSELLEVK